LFTPSWRHALAGLSSRSEFYLLLEVIVRFGALRLREQTDGSGRRPGVPDQPPWRSIKAASSSLECR
jgi:hypothetical protein